MRSPTPRQWTASTVAVVALLALTYTAWPLVPFLTGLLPETLPVGRILWGLLFAAVFVAAVVLGRSGTRASPPWLGWLILLAWAVAIAAVTGIVLIVWLILGFPGLEEVPQLSPKQLDAIATRAFAIVAGLGGVALLVISYRRQRTTEADAERAEWASEREVSKLFTDTFTTASEQLGSEHAAVRLAGVHALARLADEAPEGREGLAQMVIDVLCAYLRMPYTPEPESLPKNASKGRREEHRERELEFASFREVRHTIIRIIGDRLREPTHWRGKNYDFTGAVFDGGDLSGAHFIGGKVSFYKAEFIGGTVNFRGARFSGGTVNFSEARFSGGTVNFSEAEFTGGEVDFYTAEFTGGEVDFTGVQVIGGGVNFMGAEVTGGEVYFVWAWFSGGEVSFAGVRFGGGEVSFARTRFLGGSVSFFGADFAGGEVDFMATEFTGGTVDFSNASGKCPQYLPPRLWRPAEGEGAEPGAS